MIKISETLIKTTKPHAHSERAELVGVLVDGINATRGSYYIKNGKRIKLKPVSPAFVATKVAHLKKLEDLRYLISICKQGKHFSQVFFGSLKTGDKSLAKRC